MSNIIHCGHSDQAENVWSFGLALVVSLCMVISHKYGTDFCIMRKQRRGMFSCHIAVQLISLCLRIIDNSTIPLIPKLEI